MAQMRKRVVSELVAALEEGVPRWRRPWSEGEEAGGCMSTAARSASDAEAFIDALGAEVRHTDSECYYDHKRDRIHLPDAARFESRAEYLSTALHELAHWTGHASRLNRRFGGSPTDARYAREELIAELASAFLCRSLGVDSDLTQHAAYMDFWLHLLKRDGRYLFTAAKKAEAAAGYLERRAYRRIPAVLSLAPPA